MQASCHGTRGGGKEGIRLPHTLGQEGKETRPRGPTLRQPQKLAPRPVVPPLTSGSRTPQEGYLWPLSHDPSGDTPFSAGSETPFHAERGRQAKLAGVPTEQKAPSGEP